ncbi:MAG: hypothetical protein OXH94_14205 [Rhodospirillales bacterium]|nr:hypothetical protein [Rhodospirillales bacterium]
MNPSIAIIGTGANGSCAGADLTQAGLDVTMIDQWPAHVEAMRTNGLTIKMPEEEKHADVDAHHLCDVAGLNRTFDLVLVMPKAYDTRWMAQLMEPHLAEDGLMIGIQNAMTAGIIEDVAGPERTLGCVVELSSEIFTPGLVQRNTPPAKTWFGIGALNPEMAERIDEVREILSHVGQVSVTGEILPAKWMKLVVNTMCLGPLAMLGLTMHEANKLPGLREFVLKAGTEALHAGQRRGYAIQPIFGLTEDDIRETNQLLETLYDKLGADIGPAARDCVLQDHLKGRYSEVDLINGLVAEESAANGGTAPANAAVTEITAKIHAGELKPDPANLQLALEMMRDSTG